jgi:ParB-like chromosome segregation protein Spo0J
MMTALQVHPWADKFPLLSDSEFEDLRDDIERRGQREKILVRSGHIIDGRHRYRACCELGIEPVVEEYQGDDLIGEIASRNLFRRHLTGKQRAELVAAMLGDQLEKEARENSMANLKKGDESPDGIKRNHRETGRTRERIAEIARVSPSTAQRALRARKNGAARKPKEIDKTDSKFIIGRFQRFLDYWSPTQHRAVRKVIGEFLQ